MPVIATKFTTSGDKEYRNALKEINSGLSVLRSEMKKATAEYELNEDASEGLAEKNDILDRTLLSLADKLEVQKKRWKELAEQYGEADVRTQRLAKEINETAAEMAKAENAIKKNEKAMEDYTNAAEDSEDESKTLADAVQDLADEFGINLPGQLKNSLGAVGDMDIGMAGLAGTMATVIAKIGEMALETAEWAKELEKTSDVTGLSTDSLQQLEAVAVATGAEYDQLIDGTKDLLQNAKEAAEGNGELADTFRELGVSITDPKGELRSMDEIYWDTIYGLSEMTNESERSALAMELMGESARELNPIFQMTSEEMDQVRQSAVVMSNETISNVNAMRIGVEQSMYNIRRALQQGFGEFADWFMGDLKFSGLHVESGMQNPYGRNAHGTEYWRGGVTWVGEHGPELLELPAGSSITPAAAAGGDTFNITVNAANIKELNDLVRIAENARMSQRMGYIER